MRDKRTIKHYTASFRGHLRDKKNPCHFLHTMHFFLLKLNKFSNVTTRVLPIFKTSADWDSIINGWAKRMDVEPGSPMMIEQLVTEVQDLKGLSNPEQKSTRITRGDRPALVNSQIIPLAN